MGKSEIRRFNNDVAQLREIMRNPGASCTVSPVLYHDKQYLDSYELISPELWRVFMSYSNSNRFGSLHVAMHAFLLASYEEDEMETEIYDIEGFAMPYCSEQLKIAIVEPTAVYYHLPLFPRKVFLKEAMHMFMRGLGYHCEKDWVFSFNLLGQETMQLEDLP